MNPAFRFVLLALTLAGLARPALAQTANCSPRGQTVFVDQRMRDVYYWYREMPAVNARSYSEPGAYLDAVIYKALDRGFTYITPRATNDAYIQNSEFVGVGITRKLVSNDEYRIAQVYAGSPADEAGLARGDRVLEINGRTIADLVATGDLGGATGPDLAGVKVRFKVRRGTAEREVEITKRVVAIPNVPHVAVFPVEGGGRVGYVHLQNFSEPANAALDAAFAQLETAAVTDLVLDVRYNGGGLLSVAQHLAGLIGGARTEGQILGTFVYNDRYSERNTSFRMDRPAHALTMPRLVVITTRSSASASELIVNGLRPYIPVTTVGDRTYGKPAGQVPINFCDQVLVPATFVLKNAAGFGEYFDGLPADCAAPDDLDHSLVDPAEGSLAEALYFLKNGRCSAQASAQVRATVRRPEPPREVGWRAVLNAD
jgi:carboxyl-terminal processing protease